MSSVELDLVDHYVAEKIFSSQVAQGIREFYACYLPIFDLPDHERAEGCRLFTKWVELVAQQLRQPYQFDLFHRSVRSPFDYYQFGLDFIRPLIDFPHSELRGLEHIGKIALQLEQGDNVILLANHQIEPDPQILSLLLEPITPKLAVDMVFMAGHRVTSDPLAVPFSLGRNLLCIYSKKHIVHPPEARAQKLAHNQRTMKQLSELMNQGGLCLYVAPSGGRDRPDASGIVNVAPFDPQSIEMLWLLAQQAARTTHFYPLALKTYALMPPPGQMTTELGEKRLASFTPVYVAFEKEIDLLAITAQSSADKRLQRSTRANTIWQAVKRAYSEFVRP